LRDRDQERNLYKGPTFISGNPLSFRQQPRHSRMRMIMRSLTMVNRAGLK
jgi:hypothetical protein